MDFEFLTAYPTYQMSSQALRSENKLTVEKTQLEQSQNVLFDEKSQAIIVDAKNVDELEKIDNLAAREHAKINIENLRLSRLSPDSYSKRIASLDRIAKSYLELAQDSQKQKKHAEYRNYMMQADENQRLIDALQERANGINYKMQAGKFEELDWRGMGD